MHHSARPGRAWMAVPALAAGALLLAGAPAFAADTAPVYNVTQEGMTSTRPRRSPTPSASRTHCSRRRVRLHVGGVAHVPNSASASGKDEDGNATTSQALDMDALQSIKPLPDATAARAGSQLLALTGSARTSRRRRRLAHGAELSDAKGKLTDRFPLDTAVSYNLTLGGLPVTGQGAKLRIAFAGDGSVTQLSDTHAQARARQATCRSSRRRRPPSSARRSTTTASSSRQPTLGYLFPAIGAVKTIFPSTRATRRRARPRRPTASSRRSPASRRTPSERDMKRRRVIGDASVDGGAAPYTTSGRPRRADRRVGATRTSIQRPRVTGSRRRAADPRGHRRQRHHRHGVAALPATAASPRLRCRAAAASASSASARRRRHREHGRRVAVRAGQAQRLQERDGQPRHRLAFDWRGRNAWENGLQEASARRPRLDLRRQRRRPVVHGSRLVGRLHVQDTTHDDGSIVPSDADGATATSSGCSSSRARCSSDTNGLARLLPPAGDRHERAPHAQRVPHERVLHRRRHRR